MRKQSSTADDRIESWIAASLLGIERQPLSKDIMEVNIVGYFQRHPRRARNYSSPLSNDERWVETTQPTFQRSDQAIAPPPSTSTVEPVA
jgi:hypothetical protein